MSTMERKLKKKKKVGVRTLGKGDYSFSDELIRFDWDRLCATGLEYK